MDDISNDFNVDMDNDNDDEDDEVNQMFQNHQQNQKTDQSKHSIKQQPPQQMMDFQDDDDDNEDEDEEDEENDDHELKMYEQFLAQNKQDQQQLAMVGQQDLMISNQPSQPQFDDQEDDENQDGDDDGDIDLDNIDYDDLDPQILELAEQMGVHPKEVLKQMLKMQNEGYGDEDDEGDEDEEEMDEEELKQQLEQVQQQQKLQSSNKKQQPTQSTQKQKQQPVQKLPHELIEEDSNRDSYISENELLTKDKLVNRQTYSAPYIIINDCFDDKLCDTESEQQDLESANTTTVLKNLSDQEFLQQQMESANQQMLMQQQQIMQQQQHQRQGQGVNITNSSAKAKINQSSNSNHQNQQMHQQQQQHQFQDEVEEDDDELDIDLGQKLEQLKQQQLFNDQMLQQQNIDQDDNQNDDQEGEDEEEYDDDMLVDLDQLDETNKQMLLEYLQQEYEKNPGQFPFPKELLEQHQLKLKNKQSDKGVRQDTDSVRDIKSDEIIVEDTSQQNHVGQIEGGEQEIEQLDDENGEDQENDDYDENDLTPEQQQQFQMLLQQQQMQQQMQQQNQDYGEEQDEEDGQQLDEIQQQMLQNYQLQQQLMMQEQQKKRKIVKKGLRPKSAGTKKKVASSQQQQQLQQNLLTQQQYMQQEQLLQQQQILAMLQQEGVDIENLDPNILNQLIIAQSQQQQQQQEIQKPAKRKSSSLKKKPLINAGNRNLQKLQPYQMPKSMKILGPITPSTQLKSFNTNRSYNQNFSKKKKRKSSAKKQALTVNPSQHQYQLQQPDENLNNQMPIPYEMPVLSEEYLNQLSEEQLQQLLEHQQQLMMIQQQQQFQAQQQNSQMKKSIRPKSAKNSKAIKVPQSYASYYQPFNNIKRKVTGKTKKKKKKKTINNIYQGSQIDHQGVMMNNYFPALEAGNQLIANSQLTEEGTLTKDQRYPKFTQDMYNIPGQMIPQEQIDEVSPEQEEAESQENIQKMSQFYPQQQMHDQQHHQQMLDQDEVLNPSGIHHQDQDIEQDGMDQDHEDPSAHTGDYQDGPGDEGTGEIELTDEQLFQLIQNAHNLTPDQQVQLQMILQQKMKNEMIHERAQSYQNIYQILMDNVRKAKERLANLGQPNGYIDDQEETDQRILRQKQEFEALYRQYNHEMKQKEMKKRTEDSKVHKKMQREVKIQTIKEKKFQEELINHQKSLNYKRNAQQVRLCQKVYKLASELEKNKLLAEKKDFKENISKKKQQSKQMVDALENFYKNMISMLKDKIQNEKFERKIASQAQQQAMSKMKRELNQQKKLEVERYLQLLRQEDEKYDFESTNLQKMENEIIKLYKK